MLETTLLLRLVQFFLYLIIKTEGFLTLKGTIVIFFSLSYWHPIQHCKLLVFLFD